MPIQAEVTLQDKGVSRALLNILEGLDEQSITEVLERVGQRIGRTVVLHYPAATGQPLRKKYTWPDGTRSKFTSLRHQRGFFALLRRGKISIPHRRSGTLARAVQFEIVPHPNGVLIRASLPDKPEFRKYRFVVGRKSEQSGYFRRQTNWKPLSVMLMSSQQQAEIQQSAAVAVQLFIEEMGLA